MTFSFDIVSESNSILDILNILSSHNCPNLNKIESISVSPSPSYSHGWPEITITSTPEIISEIKNWYNSLHH